MSARRAVAALVLGLALLVGPARAAVAQDSARGTIPATGHRSVDGSQSQEPLPMPEMIPRPNEGHKPIDSGDLGGSLQFLVLGLMVLAISGGTAYVIHESRKARAAQDARDPLAR